MVVFTTQVVHRLARPSKIIRSCLVVLYCSCCCQYYHCVKTYGRVDPWGLPYTKECVWSVDPPPGCFVPWALSCPASDDKGARILTTINRSTSLRVQQDYCAVAVTEGLRPCRLCMLLCITRRTTVGVAQQAGPADRHQHHMYEHCIVKVSRAILTQ